MELLLRMEQVPGVRMLEIDGQRIHFGAPDPTDFETLLDSSTDRHKLVLEVNLPLDSLVGELMTEWGVFVLIIRQVES